MTPRPYRLGQRATAMHATQEQILTAAVALLAQRGFHELSLDEVARRADVARATIYHQYGSKLGLLNGLLEYTAERAGIHTVHEALQLADPLDALDRFLEAIVHFWQSGSTVFRNVVGLGLIDPDVDGLLQSKDEGRRQSIAQLVERLDAAGLLAETVAQSQAVETLWLLTSYASFAQLRERSKLDATDTAVLLQSLAIKSILRSPARGP